MHVCVSVSICVCMCIDLVYMYIHAYGCRLLWRGVSISNIHKCIYVFTNLSARVGCNTSLIFKWNLTGLNLEFPFSSRPVAMPRIKSQSAQLFTYSWGENNWIHIFPKGISTIRNSHSFVQDLNSYHPIYNSNHYTTNASAFVLYVCMWMYLYNSTKRIARKVKEVGRF